MEHIFVRNYKEGIKEIVFSRDDLIQAALDLGIPLPKNIGDIVYSFRYRAAFPDAITSTQPHNYEWIIQGIGRGVYKFILAHASKIVPREELLLIKIPDATPEIIIAHALGDEQALLAKIRYNRLIDIFLGLTTFSLQNHLRTTVAGIGQIEIDEIYIALDKNGRQYIIPVQAKCRNDKHGVVQTLQDIACCAEKFPNLIYRPVSSQFIDNNQIAMFEFVAQNGEIKVVEEKHYQLVPASEITPEDLVIYKR